MLLKPSLRHCHRHHHRHTHSLRRLRNSGTATTSATLMVLTIVCHGLGFPLIGLQIAVRGRPVHNMVTQIPAVSGRGVREEATQIPSVRGRSVRNVVFAPWPLLPLLGLQHAVFGRSVHSVATQTPALLGRFHVGGVVVTQIPGIRGQGVRKVVTKIPAASGRSVRNVVSAPWSVTAISIHH